MKQSSRKRRLWTLALCVVLSLAFCLTLQYTAVCDLQSRHARIVSPVHIENTLLRLQNIPHLTGDCVFMGSSITERFPITENTSVIAVPSSSFTAACILMDRCVQFPEGTIYVLEVNNLFNGNYWDVLHRTEAWDFYALADSKFFSLSARPVNLLVSYMYLYATSSDQQVGEDECFDTPVEQPVVLQGEPPTEEELQEWSEILQRMQKLRAKGGKLCLAYYPTKDLKGFEKSYAKAKKLAVYADVPLLNYNKAEWLPKLVFTDHNHQKSRVPETAKFRNTVARDARKCAR